MTDKTLLPRLNELIAESHNALEEVDMFDLDSANPVSKAQFDELERRYFAETSALVEFVTTNRDGLIAVLNTVKAR